MENFKKMEVSVCSKFSTQKLGKQGSKRRKCVEKRDRAEEQRYKVEEPVCNRGLTQGV